MYDEKLLIIELRNGNHEAFYQLYERYRARVYNFIANMVLSKDESEDIFQCVFVKVWNNRSGLNPDLSFSAYIYAITRNEIYSYWRKCMNKKQFENHLAHTGSDAIQIEDSIIDRDFRQYLSSVIVRLPKRRKEIFIMRYFQNMSYKEIAERLRISESTVDNQLQKALSTVRNILSKEFSVTGLLMGYIYFLG